MGEMSSMLGSVMQATKGPADPGVQPTARPDMGPYSPSAAGSYAAAQGGGSMTDAGPIVQSLRPRQPDAPAPELAQYRLSAGGPPPATAPAPQSVSAPAGIFSNVAPSGGVSTEGAPDQERFNIPAMVGIANSTAQLGRGLMSDMSRGAPASPLAPRPAAGGMPYQPTARNRPMTLRDILARR